MCLHKGVEEVVVVWMSLKLGSNITSLSVQRHLSSATGQLSRSSERLSSGLRINSASDDAAGLAIASTLNADNRIYGQAIRNINDALSVTALSETALQELNKITLRQRELSTQSANSVFTAKQREAIDAEARALSSEYNRIIETTTFNGRQLLKDQSAALSVQMGKGDGANLSFNLAEVLGGGAASGAAGSGSSMSVTVTPGSYFTINTPAQQYNVWYSVDGQGAAPAVAGTAVKVNLYSSGGSFNLDAQGIRNAVGAALGALGTMTVANSGTDALIVTNNATGAAVDAQNVSAGNVSISVLTQGNSAVFGFAAATNYALPGAPAAMELADVNADGILDAFAALRDTNSISLQLGNSNGTFGAVTTVASTSAGPTDVSLADINNDGKLDLLSVSDGGQNLDVFLGNGNGTFGAATSYNIGSGLFSMQSADLNNDGFKDVMVGGYSGGTRVLLNQGNGTFGAPVQVEADRGEVFQILTGDVDNDGKVDMVTSAYNSTVMVNYGDGSGGFSGSSEVYMDTGPEYLRGIALGDINNDGYLDLASGINWGVNVQYNAGNGTFGLETSYAGGIADLAPSFTDMNGDGKLDLVAAGNYSTDFHVALGNGSGSFGAFQTFSLGAAVGDGISDMRAVDINGDGSPDVVAVNRQTSQLVVRLNNGVTAAEQTRLTFTDGYQMTAGSAGTGSTDTGAESIDLTNRVGALAAMTILDSRMTRIQQQLGQIGAVQSRLEVALNTLTTSRENVAGAASRITDTDMAAETALYARSEINQRAAQAVLAQANTAPRIALALLQEV